MRAIKFRVWNLEAKEMLTVTNLELFENGDVVARHDDGNYQFGALVSHPKSDVFLMQYTGLKDKNGKEIYEGDILKWEYPAGYSLAEVKFGLFDNGKSYEDKEKGNGWYIKEYAHYKDVDEVQESINPLLLDDYPLGFYPFDVIGNIYSNPELIEGGTK